MDFKENIESIVSSLEKMVKSETVVGNPITVGEFTLVPIINTSFGFGTGLGQGKDPKSGQGSGAGGGIGAKLSATALVVIKGDEIQLFPLAGKGGIEKLVDLVPEIIAKFSKEQQPAEE